MLRFVLFVCLLVGSVSGSIFSQPEEKKEVPQVKVTDRCLQLYREMDLEGKVNYAAFRQAVTGYYRIGGRKREVLTLIDFSKPSTQERLYVFDCFFLRSFLMGKIAGITMPLLFLTKTVR